MNSSYDLESRKAICLSENYSVWAFCGKLVSMKNWSASEQTEGGGGVKTTSLPLASLPLCRLGNMAGLIN